MIFDKPAPKILKFAMDGYSARLPSGLRLTAFALEHFSGSWTWFNNYCSGVGEKIREHYRSKGSGSKPAGHRSRHEPWCGGTMMGTIRELLEKRLPLNRKEVYFTATVLPAIICADGFCRFDRFLKLLGAH
jgi:hypothetical protein